MESSPVLIMSPSNPQFTLSESHGHFVHQIKWQGSAALPQVDGILAPDSDEEGKRENGALVDASLQSSSRPSTTAVPTPEPIGSQSPASEQPNAADATLELPSWAHLRVAASEGESSDEDDLPDKPNSVEAAAASTLKHLVPTRISGPGREASASPRTPAALRRAAANLRTTRSRSRSSAPVVGLVNAASTPPLLLPRAISNGHPLQHDSGEASTSGIYEDVPSPARSALGTPPEPLALRFQSHDHSDDVPSPSPPQSLDFRLPMNGLVGGSVGLVPPKPAPRRRPVFDGIVIPSPPRRLAKTVASDSLARRALVPESAASTRPSVTNIGIVKNKDSRRRLVFDGVEIPTRPAEKARWHAQSEGGALADALKSMFTHNRYDGTPPSTPVPEPLPLPGRVPKSRKERGAARLLMAPANQEDMMRREREFRQRERREDLKPLTVAEIDAALDTEVADIMVKDAREGEDERLEQSVKRNVRFLIDGAEVGMDVDSEAGGHWAVARMTKSERFLERLEELFGPGVVSQGVGGRPRKQVTKRKRIEEPESSPPLWMQTESDMDTTPADEGPGAAEETEADAGTPVGEETVNEWTAALQRLVKGKQDSDRAELRRLSTVLDEIDRARDSLPAGTRLAELVRQISELAEIPFGDVHELRRRAGAIAEGWV